MRNVVVILLIMLLSGCLSPVKVEPENNYMLNAIAQPIKKTSNRPITLYVGTPDTVSAFNTNQMAYSIKPYQIAYFGKNRWAETPSQMLQPLIVQSLLNTGYFQAIVTPPFVGNYHYMLHTQILELQQNFTHKPAEFQLIARVQLSKMATGQVIGTKQFVIREPIKQRTPYGGVLAANRATEKLMIQLTRFCLEKM